MAAVRYARIIRDFNAERPPEAQLPLDNVAVHYVSFVVHTHIHWHWLPSPYIYIYNQFMHSLHNKLCLLDGVDVQGTVLLVEGTDIHWGDPVNTASKLAEDIQPGPPPPPPPPPAAPPRSPGHSRMCTVM